MRYYDEQKETYNLTDVVSKDLRVITDFKVNLHSYPSDDHTTDKVKEYKEHFIRDFRLLTDYVNKVSRKINKYYIDSPYDVEEWKINNPRDVERMEKGK